MNICVFGASSDDIESIYFEEVTKLGEIMAQRGHTLVFGAGAHGLMGAVVRGAASKNGDSIGIVPRFFDEGDIVYKDCTELVYTETVSERKKIMEERSDAFIMVPGGSGTYEEFFDVLNAKQLGKHSKAVTIFNVNGYYDKFEELMLHTIDTGFMKAEAKVYKTFSDAEELISYIESENTVNRG